MLQYFRQLIIKNVTSLLKKQCLGRADIKWFKRKCILMCYRAQKLNLSKIYWSLYNSLWCHLTKSQVYSAPFFYFELVDCYPSQALRGGVTLWRNKVFFLHNQKHPHGLMGWSEFYHICFSKTMNISLSECSLCKEMLTDFKTKATGGVSNLVSHFLHRHLMFFIPIGNSYIKLSCCLIKYLCNKTHSYKSPPSRWAVVRFIRPQLILIFCTCSQQLRRTVSSVQWGQHNSQ